MFPAEMQAKFGTRVSANQLEFHDDKLRFAKLQNSAKGNSISIPRTAYYVENMRCIPLYMLYAFIEGMKPYPCTKLSLHLRRKHTHPSTHNCWVFGTEKLIVCDAGE